MPTRSLPNWKSFSRIQEYLRNRSRTAEHGDSTIDCHYHAVGQVKGNTNAHRDGIIPPDSKVKSRFWGFLGKYRAICIPRLTAQQRTIKTHPPTNHRLEALCRIMVRFHGKNFERSMRERTAVRAEIVKISSEYPRDFIDQVCRRPDSGRRSAGHADRYVLWMAADPFNLRAVDRVYDIKTRSRHKPLSLLIENVDQAEEMAKSLSEEFYALARKYWPGPLTLIVKAGSRLPLKVTANTGNVALRVPNAKIPLAVVTAAAIPITATSANLSGATECTSAEQVRDQLEGRIEHHRGWRDFAARRCFYHHRPDR